MWDCFSFKKKYFMFTHWTKRWSKCSIDSFILTHFNLDFLTIDQDLSLAFRAIYRAHGSVLMKYNSCHFIIIFIHCRVILHMYMGYTLIFLCNFCLSMVASCLENSMVRLSTSRHLLLLWLLWGRGGIFFLEQGPSTHRNYISINSITFLQTVPGKLLFQIFAHKKTLIFWKSSVVLLKKFDLKTNEFILLNLEVCLSYLIMIIVEYRGDKPQMCRFIQEFYHHLLLMSRLDINFKNN